VDVILLSIGAVAISDPRSTVLSAIMTFRPPLASTFDLAVKIVIPLTVALRAHGGLAAACFVKAFGITLGLLRSEHTEHA
jgi:hypothetical protein